jgi:hypothetical protein
MPPVSSYTDEAQLAQFMLDELSDIGTALGWTGLSNLQHAINKSLRAYGVDVITDATDVIKLEALGAREAWAAACRALAARIDQDADGGDFKRSQYLKHAQQMLQRAEEEAVPYLGTEFLGPGSGAAPTVASW